MVQLRDCLFERTSKMLQLGSISRKERKKEENSTLTEKRSKELEAFLENESQ